MEWRLQNIAVHPHHRHTQPCAAHPLLPAQRQGCAGRSHAPAPLTRGRPRAGSRSCAWPTAGNFSTWRVRLARAARRMSALLVGRRGMHGHQAGRPARALPPTRAPRRAQVGDYADTLMLPNLGSEAVIRWLSGPADIVGTGVAVLHCHILPVRGAPGRRACSCGGPREPAQRTPPLEPARTWRGCHAAELCHAASAVNHRTQAKAAQQEWRGSAQPVRHGVGAAVACALTERRTLLSPWLWARAARRRGLHGSDPHPPVSKVVCREPSASSGMLAARGAAASPSRKALVVCSAGVKCTCQCPQSFQHSFRTAAFLCTCRTIFVFFIKPSLFAGCTLASAPQAFMAWEHAHHQTEVACASVGALYLSCNSAAQHHVRVHGDRGCQHTHERVACPAHVGPSTHHACYTDSCSGCSSAVCVQQHAHCGTLCPAFGLRMSMGLHGKVTGPFLFYSQHRATANFFFIKCRRWRSC